MAVAREANNGGGDGLEEKGKLRRRLLSSGIAGGRISRLERGPRFQGVGILLAICEGRKRRVSSEAREKSERSSEREEEGEGSRWSSPGLRQTETRRREEKNVQRRRRSRDPILL